MGCSYGRLELVHQLLFSLWISLNLLVEGCSLLLNIVALIFFPLTALSNLQIWSCYMNRHDLSYHESRLTFSKDMTHCAHLFI